METNPHVVCICLTADRQQQTDRAIACFRAQTYQNKSLLVMDTGAERYNIDCALNEHIWITKRGQQSIGTMRNEAIKLACDAILFDREPPALIATWDSDDWRHPGSLEDLVAGLISSKSECVGYRTALFWDSENAKAYRWKSNLGPGHILGGSMVFWRSVWERQPFPDIPPDDKGALGVGEDGKWIKTVICSSMATHEQYLNMMICERHAGNTSKIDLEYQCEHAPDAWKRVPDWDSYCEERMRL